MIEPEMAFADLNDDMQCAEDYVRRGQHSQLAPGGPVAPPCHGASSCVHCSLDDCRYCSQHLLDHCMEDLEFMAKQVDKTCIDRLRQVASSPFKRVSYTDCIALLEEVVRSGKKQFENEVFWGVDMASEHERYLTEEASRHGSGRPGFVECLTPRYSPRLQIFKQPIIVFNYPKEIKSFYMRLNDDGKTVAAMDVLVPKVGELVGGSQREDRLDVLETRMKDLGMELSAYVPYLDLRRYGSVPHAGTSRAGCSGRDRSCRRPPQRRLAISSRLWPGLRTAHPLLHGHREHPRCHPLPALARARQLRV